MASIAVVVVGYDRPRSLARVLESLKRVAFDGHRVPLIISLDRSDDKAVAEAVTRVGQDFSWEHGEKTVRTFPRRLGLKKHILACGELTGSFEHIIVLEDDLYVSPNAFRFALQAADFYKADDRIAGIGLYAHLWNVGCDRPFLPIDDAFDAYFMQFACSWGQVWSRGKWSSFVDWYNAHGEDFGPDPSIPSNVSSWSRHSWLKHHIRYCIATNRFFVYPRVSLSTNFSDKGQHNLGRDNGYQVPLQELSSRGYRLPRFMESIAMYDAFFESMSLDAALGVPPVELCVDLYGMKSSAPRARYWLTLKEGLNGRVIKTFDLALRPHEANVLHDIPGQRIRLYDTSQPTVTSPRSVGDLEDALVKYDARNIPYRRLLRYGLRSLAKHVGTKLGMKAR